MKRFWETKGISGGIWKLLEERLALKAILEAAKSRKQKSIVANTYNEKNREVKGSCRRDEEEG